MQVWKLSSRCAEALLTSLSALTPLHAPAVTKMSVVATQKGPYRSGLVIVTDMKSGLSGPRKELPTRHTTSCSQHTHQEDCQPLPSACPCYDLLLHVGQCPASMVLQKHLMLLVLKPLLNPASRASALGGLCAHVTNTDQSCCQPTVQPLRPSFLLLNHTSVLQYTSCCEPLWRFAIDGTPRS